MPTSAKEEEVAEVREPSAKREREPIAIIAEISRKIVADEAREQEKLEEEHKKKNPIEG